MKTDTREFQQRFLSWFDAWGLDLWQLCVYASRSPESVADEFPDLLEMTMKRMRTKVRASTGEAWSAHFLAQWLRLQRIRNPRTGLSATEIPLDDRCVLAALFKVGWSLERTALVLGISLSSLRFRTLQTLILVSGDASGILTPQTRDCSRYDLHAIDGVLGVEWKDPLAFFDRKAHEAHRSQCPRCGALATAIDEILAHLRSLKLAPLPASIRDTLAQGYSFASRSILVSWFSTWPWFLRVPIQLTFVAFVVFAVVTVPYVGDLFPELKQKFPRYAHLISQSILPSSEVETRLQVRAESEAAGGRSVAPAKVEDSLASSGLPPAHISIINTKYLIPHMALAATSRDFPMARSEDYLVAAPWRVGPTGEADGAVAETLRAFRAHPSVAPRTPTAPIAKVTQATPSVAIRVATPLPTPSSETLRPPEDSHFAESMDSASFATAGPVQPAPLVVLPKSGTSDLSKSFYRWGAFSPKIEEDSPRILQLLQKHGVSNAGGLELGARHLGGLYYHFYVDNGALDLLVAELSSLGLADFSRTKAHGIRNDHPPGKTRVVFLVKPGRF